MVATRYLAISALLGQTLCGGWIIAIAQPPPIDISGNWQLSWIGKDQVAHQAVAEFHESGTAITGSLTVNGHALPLSGNVKDRQIAFIAENFFRRVAFTGAVAGNEMKGTTDENIQWSAKRN